MPDQVKMDSLIITGGHIDLPFAEKVYKSRVWDQVIAADAGLRFCLEEDIVPDLIIGDFDSAGTDDLRAFLERCPERIKTFPAVKDETDTELALGRALDAGADYITILGGTGSRLDHVLGNVQILARALDAGAESFMVDPHNRIRMIREKLTLKRDEQFGHYVSLIPFSGAVKGLTLTGFAYEAEDLTLDTGTSRGISNEIRDDKARIEFSEGTLIVIESMD